MLFTTSLTMLAMVAHHEETPKLEDLLSGIFSNEEHVYFEKDAGRDTPPWMSFNISHQDGEWAIVHIDAFGAETGKRENVRITNGEPRAILTVENCARNFDRATEGWTYSALQNRKLCRQDYPQCILAPPTQMYVQNPAFLTPSLAYVPEECSPSAIDRQISVI
ncbi:hypothetical protein [Parasphingorhabdus halotolerans]|uniref:Uncharacterized protein n=1 Tax=Parasphingorhabdus halotolerans TaxID=2725558 RepID=A0A6H2DNB6_9SPHN|nr:hypothetical protein [Parasphingorhabdus halotolerans]QJB69880.1 hypothetical protein HF685_11805 [Parasphingorhabdus halotolerans]